jgi:hypothetical protein
MKKNKIIRNGGTRPYPKKKKMKKQKGDYGISLSGLWEKTIISQSYYSVWITKCSCFGPAKGQLLNKRILCTNLLGAQNEHEIPKTSTDVSLYLQYRSPTLDK